MSSFLKLGIPDILKGFVVAVFTAVITALIPILQGGGFPDGPTLIGILWTSLAAGLAYLLKNFLTNSSGELFKPE